MGKIIGIEEAAKISEALWKEDKKLILAGGCFDILHKGHILFLQKAKELGDVLMILLENDKHISELKGPGRPINTQSDRATILSSIQFVDYVILLPDMMSNLDYDKVISKLKPAIIATTAGDTYRFHKERQAKMIGAKVVDAIDVIENLSTTQIAEKIQKEK